MEREDKVYDVVVVGAGIAGALLVEQLLKDNPDCSILMLEAGTGTGLTADGYDAFVNTYHGALDQVPNSPYPNNPNAPQSNVLDIQKIGSTEGDAGGCFVQRGPLPFSSTNTRTTGGTTMHWLGTCLRMLPNDFEMRTRYGHGVDWPIKYDDFMGDYRKAEEAIGVSADKQDQVGARGVPNLRYADWYQYPMKKIPQSFVDRSLAERIDGLVWKETGPDNEDLSRQLYVTSTPQGRNSTPNSEYPGPNGDQQPRGFTPRGNPEKSHVGERCEGNASCIPICPVMAKYNAVRTLGRLSRDRFEIRVQAVASSIDLDPQSGEVRGIAYKRYTSVGQPHYTTQVARGRLYVVAASAIETARLLIASNAARYSSQLGRNLMDHPTLLTWGLFPERIGSYRGPGSTSGIPSLRDGDFRKYRSGFRVEIGNWGWNWATGAPRSTVEQLVGLSTSGGEPRFGAQLRRALYDECQRQFRLAFLVEQTPMFSNRVTVDPQYRDQLGNLRPVLYYDLDDYTKLGLKTAWDVSKALYERACIDDKTVMDESSPGYFEYDGTPLVYYGAGHIVGTHRMGNTPRDSVTDTSMRTWEHRKLFLVGCGSMPTIGTSNPTLTLGALAMRAARAISAQLRGEA